MVSELHNVSIYSTSVYDIYGNEVDTITVSIYPNYYSKLNESQFSRVEISVSPDAQPGVYSFAIYGTSDDIPYTTPTIFNITIHMLQSDDPTDYCYVPIEYKIPFLKIVPQKLSLQLLENHSTHGLILLENGAPTNATLQYELTCGNTTSSDIISLIPGRITPFEVNINHMCNGSLELTLKDFMNNTLQKEIIPITVTEYNTSNSNSISIVDCDTLNPVPREIDVTITKPRYTYTLCVENTGDSTITNLFTISDLPIVSLEYILDNKSIFPPYLPPSQYMKILFTFDTTLINEGTKIPITIYGDKNVAKIILNVSEINQPLLNITPNHLTIDCDGAEINITNTGTFDAWISYSIEGDLRKYIIPTIIDFNLNDFNLTSALNISPEMWVGPSLGKNIINFKDNETTVPSPEPLHLRPGESITLKLLPNYLKYYLDSSGVTSGILNISSGVETHTIPIELESAQLNCSSNESTIVYYVIPSQKEYQNQGLLSLITYHPPEFPFKDMVKIYLFNYYKGSLETVHTYINGQYIGTQNIGSHDNVFAICVTELGILDCYKKLQFNENASIIIGHTKNTTLKISSVGLLNITLETNGNVTIYTSTGRYTLSGVATSLRTTDMNSLLLFTASDFSITTYNPHITCSNTTISTTYGEDEVYLCQVNGTNTTVQFISTDGWLNLYNTEVYVGGLNITNVSRIEISGNYTIKIDREGLLELYSPGEVYYINESTNTNQTLSNVILQINISGNMIGNISGKNIEMETYNCTTNSCEYIIATTHTSFGNISFLENAIWYYMFKIEEPLHCPLYSISPEFGELYVPPDGSDSQEFIITNIGNFLIKTLKSQLTGENELLTWSSISPSKIFNLNPNEESTISWIVNVPDTIQPNTTYRGAMIIKEKFCGIKYIPLTLHVVHYTLTIIPYDVDTGENLTGMEVYTFSNRVALKEISKGHYITHKIRPGTHTLVVFDPSFTYLPTVLPITIMKNEFNKILKVPMQKGEILNLSVDVDCNESLAEMYNDPYGCYVNGGSYMNISIITNIKNLKFMIPMNFTVEFSAVNITKTGNISGSISGNVYYDHSTGLLYVTNVTCIDCTIQGTVRCINGTCTSNTTQNGYCSFHGDFSGQLFTKDNETVSIRDLFCVGSFWNPESTCTYSQDFCNSNCSCNENVNCSLHSSKITMICTQKMLYNYKISYRCDPPLTQYGFCYIPVYYRGGVTYPPMYWLYLSRSLRDYVFGVGYPPAFFAQYFGTYGGAPPKLAYIPEELWDLFRSKNLTLFYDVFKKTTYEISSVELRNFNENAIQIIETANITVTFSSYYLRKGELFFAKATVKHPGEYPYPAYNVSLQITTSAGIYIVPVNETTGDFTCVNGFCTDTTKTISWPYIDIGEYKTYTWKLRPGGNLPSGTYNFTFILKYKIFVGDQWRETSTSVTVPVTVVKPALLTLETATNVNYLTSDPRVWPGKRFPVIVVVYNQGYYPEYNVKVYPEYSYNINFLTSCEFEIPELRGKHG